MVYICGGMIRAGIAMVSGLFAAAFSPTADATKMAVENYTFDLTDFGSSAYSLSVSAQDTKTRKEECSCEALSQCLAEGGDCRGLQSELDACLQRTGVIRRDS